MKRILAALLAALLALPGCALRVPVGGRNQMGGPHREKLLVPIGQKSPQSAAHDATVWRRYVESIPVGSKVKVRTTDGESMKAIYMGVENEGVLLKPRTRIPEPVREVPIANLANIEIDSGSSIGKTIAISAAAAGAAVLCTFLILFAVIDD